MNKPLVFISHITEEKDIALALKDFIRASFLGMIDIFVSSDSDDLSLGRKWLDDITESLNTCVVEIVLCSPISVKRPWINFEIGAGWIRNIEVIPLCHSGIEPSNLPVPLNMLQAGKATDASIIKRIFQTLSKIAESEVPDADFSGFINRVRNLELNYLDSENLPEKSTDNKSSKLSISQLSDESKLSTWDLLFENDEKGNSIGGSLDRLIECVKKGYSIKIRIHLSNNIIKVIEAQSISVDNGVVHAINTSEISLGRDTSGNYVYQEKAYHYYVIASSNGHFHERRIFLDGAERNTTNKTRHMAWIGLVPPS